MVIKIKIPDEFKGKTRRFPPFKKWLHENVEANKRKFIGSYEYGYYHNTGYFTIEDCNFYC